MKLKTTKHYYSLLTKNQMNFLANPVHIKKRKQDLKEVSVQASLTTAKCGSGLRVPQWRNR